MTGLSSPCFVDTSRGRYAYRTAGDPGGVPLVLLHGWPESSWCWNEVAAHLPSGLRVIAADLRGLGDSNRDGDKAAYEKQSLAADIVTVLDELGIGEFVLAGHDWGGPVAQEIALAAEPRVRRLILLNTPIINNVRGNAAALERIAAGESRQHWYQHFMQVRELPEIMIEGKEREWLGYFLRTYERRPLPEQAIAEYVRCYSIPGTPSTGANYYRTIREDRRRWATLGGHVWPMPALFIYGHRDPTVVPEYLHHAQACFRDLRLASFEAGHFIQEERPGQVAELIGDWLRKTWRPL